jgi:rare lipoprotein A
MRTFWKSRSFKLKRSHQIYLLAGISSAALTVVVITLSTQSVQADARLPKPAPIAHPLQNAAPLRNATPPSLEAKRPEPESRTKTLRGLASWYGSVFHGRHTASGERYDMYAMTACHPTLPFGTLVRVENLSNHKSVVVRINDRGDLKNKRAIDISYAAAEKLHILKSGVTRVAMEVIRPEESHHKK